MKFKNKASALITRVFALLLLFSGAGADSAFAQGTTTTSNNNGGGTSATAGGNTAALGAGNAESGTNDSNPGTAWDIRKNYFLRFPVAQEFGPYEAGGTDVIKDKVSQGTATGGTPMVVHSLPGCPVYVWPIYVPTAASTVPTYRDMAIDEDLFQTFGFPVSDTQFQIIQRYNDNRMLEEMFDPERIMWLTSTIAGMQSTSAANGAANMTTNQSQSAIDFTKEYLTNFTAEAGNRWQVIRDQLFIPMAVLLLLPGAVLAQVKAIVSQSSPVLGETNPFEGIIRSIVAIFLIPGTFLVINYGIDVANSITFTIADEYTRIFGTDMYVDAQCAEARAFPINAPQSNSNSMNGSETPATSQDGTSGFGPYEALNLGIRLYDPCANIDISNSPDEEVRDAKKIARFLTNGTNCTLTLMWNTLCAFQMAFLYYLWCMGPIAAALWVWPMQKLRGALGSWVEGVIILCFWSLFWNTCVLLLACFRGVGDTGTVIVTALHYLATISVKYAFDFGSLVSQGGSGGIAQTMGNALQGAGNAMSGNRGGGSHGGGAAANHGPRMAAARGAAAGAASGAAGGHGAPGVGAAGAHPGATPALAHAGTSSSGLTLSQGHGNFAAGVGGSTGAAGSASGVGAAHQPPLSTAGQPGAGSPVTGMPPHSGAGDNAMLPSGGAALAGLPNTSHGGMTANQFMNNSNTAAGATAFTQNHNNSAAMPGAGAGNYHTPSTNVGPDGKVALDTAHMGNLNGNPMDPNSQSHQQLSEQLKALNSGDPNALHAQSANAGQAMDANSKAAYDNFTQNGQHMSAADQAAVNSFAEGKGGLTMGADGTLINSATGEPIHVGQGGLPPEGLHLGGQNTGVAMEANQVFSSPIGANGEPGAAAGMGAHEMQGMNGQLNNQSVDLGKLAQEHPGQNIGALSASEIGNAQTGQGLMGLAASEGVTNPQLSMNNGQMELTGANGRELAHFNASTGQWEASGTNGSVVMGSNGQWESASTHQSMAFENGQWSQSLGSQAGATASNDLHTLASMNLNPSTQDYAGQGASVGAAGSHAGSMESQVAQGNYLHSGAAGDGQYSGLAAGGGMTSGVAGEPGAAGQGLMGSSYMGEPGAAGHVLGGAPVPGDVGAAGQSFVGGSYAGEAGAAGQAFVGASYTGEAGAAGHPGFASAGINGEPGAAGFGTVGGVGLSGEAQASGFNVGGTVGASGGIGGESNYFQNASYHPGASGIESISSMSVGSQGLAGEAQMGGHNLGASGGMSAESPLSQAAQHSLSSLSQAEGLGSSVSYEATANGYAAHAANGTVIGSYDNATGSWSTTQGGGATMDSNGQWVNQTHNPVHMDSQTHQWSSGGIEQQLGSMSNAPTPISDSVQQSFNNLAQSENAGSVSYQATSNGYVAEAANGQVLGTYNNTTHEWTSSQGQGATMDGAGVWHSNVGGQTTAATYDSGSGQWMQASISSESSMSAMPQSVQSGLESLAQSATGSAQVSIETNSSGITYAEAGGHTIAQYDSGSGQWMATAGGASGGVTLDQSSGQWVAAGTHTAVSLDGASNTWSVSGSNESVTLRNGNFESAGYSAPANSVSESAIYQASHGHPEALASSSANYAGGDVTHVANYDAGNSVTHNNDMSAVHQAGSTDASVYSAQAGSTVYGDTTHVANNDLNFHHVAGSSESTAYHQYAGTAEPGMTTHHVGAPEPGMVLGNNAGSVQSTDNWFSNPVVTPQQDLSSQQTANSYQYYDPGSGPTAPANYPANYIDQTAYTQTAQASDGMQIASTSVPQQYDQVAFQNQQPVDIQVQQPVYPQQMPDQVPNYGNTEVRIADSGLDYRQPDVAPSSVDMPFGGYSSGAEAQMHVTAPDHNSVVQGAAEVAGAGAAMYAASNASHSAPVRTPDVHVAPPSSSGGSALGKVLAGATGQKLPTAQGHQAPPQSGSEPQGQDQGAQLAEAGGLAGALKKTGRRRLTKKEIEEIYKATGQMPTEDA